MVLVERRYISSAAIHTIQEKGKRRMGPDSHSSKMQNITDTPTINLRTERENTNGKMGDQKESPTP
jgi:hypothetical protein